jgi:hypothetical protein
MSFMSWNLNCRAFPLFSLASDKASIQPGSSSSPDRCLGPFGLASFLRPRVSSRGAGVKKGHQKRMAPVRNAFHSRANRGLAIPHMQQVQGGRNQHQDGRDEEFNPPTQPHIEVYEAHAKTLTSRSGVVNGDARLFPAATVALIAEWLR